MGNARPSSRKQINLFCVQLHAMGMPDVIAHPSQIFRILTWPAAEFLQRIGNVFIVLGQVRVQAGDVGRWVLDHITAQPGACSVGVGGGRLITSAEL